MIRFLIECQTGGISQGIWIIIYVLGTDLQRYIIYVLDYPFSVNKRKGHYPLSVRYYYYYDGIIIIVVVVG